MQKKLLIFIILFSLMMIVVSALLLKYVPLTVKKTISQKSTTMNAPLNLGGDFTLTSTEGKEVSSKDFRGKLLLIYFGFTFCPDICPAELHEMLAAVQLLGAKAEKVQMMFITIDPERDTASHLKEYLAAFDGNILGLTGTMEQISPVANLFKVYYAKEPRENPLDYLINHSSFIYLVNQEGKLVTLFNTKTTPEEIAQAIQNLL